MKVVIQSRITGLFREEPIEDWFFGTEEDANLFREQKKKEVAEWNSRRDTKWRDLDFSSYEVGAIQYLTMGVISTMPVYMFKQILNEL